MNTTLTESSILPLSPKTNSFQICQLSAILQPFENLLPRTLQKTMPKNMTFTSADVKSYIKVCSYLGKSATEIYETLQAPGLGSVLSRDSIFRWSRDFKKGKSGISDGRGKATPRQTNTKKNIDAVKALIDRDCRISIEEIAESVGISSGSVWNILHNDLGLRKLSARWIPHILTDENKRVRLEYATQLLSKYENSDPRRLSEIATGDETWMHFYEPMRKADNKAWRPKGGKPLKIARRSKSTTKVMYTVFFNSKGVLAQIPCKKNQSVNSVFYTQKVLPEVIRSINVQRPATGTRGIKILHDNAPAHKSEMTKAFLKDNRLEVLGHPPYSPDLAPCDFFLFPRLKRELSGRSFKTKSALGSAIYQCLSGIPENDYLMAFRSWISRLRKCVDNAGEYFEQ